MKSFRDVIAKWPSLEALAEDTGAKLVAVLQWRVRGNVPPRYWAALLRGAQTRKIEGLSLDSLDKLLAAQRAPQSQIDGNAGASAEDAA